MSKGNPVVLLRLEPKLLDAIKAAVERSKDAMITEEYTVSSWIRAAIRERFKKYKRAKDTRKRQQAERKAARERQETPAQ